ncbi:hypothetical protein KR074_010190, partial [Drosophila pseudoananassae]
MSSYFGVYIPPTKVGFEGTATQCAGSIAALNIKTGPVAALASVPVPVPVLVPASSDPVDLAGESGAENADSNAGKYEDPDYPPDSPLWLIFTEKAKALDVLRHYKEARLREFPNREQAESYVQFGFESIEALKRFGKTKPATKPIALPSNSYKGSSSGSAESSYSSSPTGSPSMSSLLSSSPTSVASSPNSNGRHHHSHSHSHNHHHQQQQQQQPAQQQQQQQPELASSGERPAFRAPTKQELVEFRKQIEAGNVDRVKRIVWENPRFLISSGDTPTSLKEGCRYNAMHICAQVNQARVAELLLKIIADREFTQLYAGKKGSGEMCAALNDNLLDYYLNMPDKARGETPLHFAVKNGHVAVVEVLIAYPQCKSLANHEGKEPRDIICLRAPQASIEVIRKLELLMYDPHYVPVLRSVANELPPQVGQPFTPNEPPVSSPKRDHRLPKITLSFPLQNLQFKAEDCEGLSVDLQISALAGPMPREKAMNFYRRWKTPPRVGGNVMSPLASSPFSSPVKVTPSKSIFNRSANGATGVMANSTPAGRRVLFSPLECSPKQQPPQVAPSNLNNGTDFENNNNNIKRVGSVELPTTPIRQMRPDLFMAYRGASTESPLAEDSVLLSCDQSLNISLGMNVSAVSTLNESFRERHIKNSDIEKGLEVVGRQLARQEQLEWREFWDFLDAFVDISTPDGLARLEAYFVEKSELARAEKSDQAWNFAQLHQYLDLVATGEQQGLKQSRHGKWSAAGGAGGAVTGVMTPYTCVEKSLQVFAKRITKTLINNIGNMVSINDTLLCELKRLKSLIVSFKDDARFMSVDFGKVHSRIAHLVASYLAHSQEVSVAMLLQLLQMLRKLRQLLPEERAREQHLGCVCGSLLQMLEIVPNNAVQSPEALKTEELCSAAWEAQPSCACLWDANLSRKTSRRKRSESMRAAKDSAAAALRATANNTGTGSPRVAIVAPVPKSANAWRQVSDDDEDFSEDDNCFYDCRSVSPDLTSSDEEDNFRTPPESLSPRLSVDLEAAYELFIFGKEPTKRDLDVLNAIFNVDVDKETLPHVHAWKTAMESFSAAEMDLFPSPKNIRKTHKPVFWSAGTPSKENNGSVNHTNQSMHPKRLFGTPKLTAAVSAGRRGSGPSTTPMSPPKPMRLPRTPASVPPAVSANPSTATNGVTSSPAPTTSTSTALSALAAAATVTQSFQTPLNKVRGLFSKYREPRVEIDSPVVGMN